MSFLSMWVWCTVCTDKGQMIDRGRGLNLRPPPEKNILKKKEKGTASPRQKRGFLLVMRTAGDCWRLQEQKQNSFGSILVTSDKEEQFFATS